jgi:hypothetical protein
MAMLSAVLGKAFFFGRPNYGNYGGYNGGYGGYNGGYGGYGGYYGGYGGHRHSSESSSHRRYGYGGGNYWG